MLLFRRYLRKIGKSWLFPSFPKPREKRAEPLFCGKLRGLAKLEIVIWEVVRFDFEKGLSPFSRVFFGILGATSARWNRLLSGVVAK